MKFPTNIVVTISESITNPYWYPVQIKNKTETKKTLSQEKNEGDRLRILLKKENRKRGKRTLEQEVCDLRSLFRNLKLE